MKPISHQSARRGVALVITLIMLAVVTVTAVAFLTVARRERAAVAAAGDQADARIAADAALTRARAHILAQMASATSRIAPTLFVSTNFVSPTFNPGLSAAELPFPGTLAQSNRWYSALTNVSYLLRTGIDTGRPFNLNSSADALEYRRMLANLLYDPRVPVVAQTARINTLPGALEDRFYLDLNRNGRFDTNGWILERNDNGVAIGTNRLWHVGDPEWIGVLADPDRPHSGNNRFLYRIAYVVVPADRTLDLNYVHNQARNPVATDSRYLRNQGVGSWELNLAAYFRDLNTNLWRNYNYQTTAANTGNTFEHGFNIWSRRRVGFQPLRGTAQEIFADDSRPSAGAPGDVAAAGRVFPRNFVDDLSNGPLIQTLDEIRNPGLLGDPDVVNVRWSGADPTVFFGSPFELLYDPSLLGFGSGVIWTNLDTRRAAFGGQLVSPTEASLSTYDAYTYYRLLGSLGTDSSDGRIESGVDRAGRYYRRGKLNLNFQSTDPSDPKSAAANLVVTNGAANGTATAFVPWSATNWMRLASDRLLRREFETGLPETNNFAFRDSRGNRIRPTATLPAAHGIPLAGRGSVTNTTGNLPEVSFTNYHYSAQAHRLIQLAANIHEVRTNIVGGRGREPFPPHIYRPTFYRQDTPAGSVVRLGGLEEITNANVVLNTAWTNWLDFDSIDDISRLPDNPITPLRTNAFGIPFVVGAKQNQTGTNALGLPKFNESFWQTRVRTGRRLVIQRPNAQAVRPTNEVALSRLGFEKFGQYTFEFVNIAAAEAWNSYLTAFPSDRPLRVIATNWTEVVVYDGNYANTTTLPYGRALSIPQPVNPLLPVTTANPLVFNRTNFSVQFGNVVRIGDGNPGYKARWDAREFVPALNTNAVFGFVFNPIQESIFPLTQTNNPQSMFRLPSPRQDRMLPRLTIAVTNRLVFAIVDDSFNPPRLLDFVNLKSGTVQSNLLDNLFFDANGNIPGIAGDAGFNNGFANTGGALGAGTGAVTPLTMPELWLTNIVAGQVIPAGFENQFRASLIPDYVQQLWVAPIVRGVRTTGDPRVDAALGLRAFLYGVNSVPRSQMDIAQRELDRMTAAAGAVNGNRIQVGYNPASDVFLTERRMANDPFVHYTKEDLQPGGIVYTYPAGYWKFYPDVFPQSNGRPPEVAGQQVDYRINDNQIAYESGTGLVAIINQTNRVAAPSKYLTAYAPWGTNANLGTGVANFELAFDMSFKDPLVYGTHSWAFPTPTNGLANVGQLGRIHRGSPWQTVYLKNLIAPAEPNEELQHFGDRHHWKMWSGSYGTHPTNDWALLDLFTTAMNENAARGTVAVNQTNLAAWSAILAGVPVIRKENQNYTTAIVGTALAGNQELLKIVAGYTNQAGFFQPGIVSGFIHTNPSPSEPFIEMPLPAGGTFTAQPRRRSLPRFESMGEICSVATLSVGSPFLEDAETTPNFPDRPLAEDEVIERIPQQILSLLKADEPRYVIYSWAQTLKPAAGATVTAPGPYFGLVTNYVVTGEFATKTVVRIEGSISGDQPVTQNLRPVVEDHRVITSE
jgi:hypothetical protein